MGVLCQGFLQATAPCNAQFSVDMYNSDPSGDCLPQIFIVGSRSAVERKWEARRPLDLNDSRDVQALPRFSLHHALQHTVHVAHGRSQDVDSGGLNVLSCFYRRC